MKCVKLDIDGKQVGEESLDIKLNLKDKNVDHWVYSAIKYQNSITQQGTSSAKTRSEVRGGGAKPYKQKGTGRARRGTSRSPLIRGGGVIFGPKTRSYATKMNKKHIKNTIKYVFHEKQSDIIILSPKEDVLSTKKIQNLVTSNEPDSAKKVLFIVSGLDSAILKSCRNIENSILSTPTTLDVTSLIKASKIIIEESALILLKEILN